MKNFIYFIVLNLKLLLKNKSFVIDCDIFLKLIYYHILKLIYNSIRSYGFTILENENISICISHFGYFETNMPVCIKFSHIKGKNILKLITAVRDANTYTWDIFERTS